MKDYNQEASPLLIFADIKSITIIFTQAAL